MSDSKIEMTKQLLRDLKIDAEIIEHKDIDGSHSEDAILALGISMDQVLKCLILRSKKKEPVAAIILGSQKLDVKKLEEITDLKKLSFASGDLVLELTGYEIGGVPPFAVIGKMPVYVDENVMKQKEVYGSGGTPFHGLKFKTSVLNKIKVKISNICV